jgi:uncharacterized protein (DUF1330 family)
MADNGNPYFLVVQISAGLPAEQYFEGVVPLIKSAGGVVQACAPAPAVEALEPGSPTDATLIAWFRKEGEITTLWESEANQQALGSLASGSGMLAVVAAGLPYEGLPDALEIPTVASVVPPDVSGPPAYMVIHGDVMKQDQMDRYRDIILPMLKDLGAYYTVFLLGSGLEVLCGEWDRDIFAISRWPEVSAGHAFWFSDRYQKVAIPTRTGGGVFHVQYLEGIEDDEG